LCIADWVTSLLSVGGDRSMQAIFQDSMGNCWLLRLCHFFITFTAHPNWDEVQAELFPGQTANDRRDLVARVFYI
jgi:hypothetical protein